MHNIIIDGSTMLYSAMSKNDDDYCDDGYYLGGVIGTLASISKCIHNLELTDRVYLTFDLFKSEFRKAIHKDYKKGRDENYSEALKQRFSHKYEHMTILSNILQYLNVYVLNVEDVEADDVIANYVAQTKHHTTIVSTDKDLLQLINDKTTVYKHTSQEFITLNNIDEYLGYPFEYFKLVKILAGDASDNISSIKGVGEKTALKILKASGLDKDSIYEYICNQKTKWAIEAKLFFEQGLFEYNQTLMDLDLGPKITISDYVNEVEYSPEKVIDIFKELEYNKHIHDWILANFGVIKP